MNLHWLTRNPLYPLPRSLIFTGEEKLLTKYAAGKKTIVEIGVFEGASARHIRSAMANDGKLTLIDPFVPDSYNPKLKARKWFAKLWVNTVKNAEVEWLEDYSMTVSAKWVNPIEFLFIDGDHNYEACLKDWNEWSKHIAPGGVVMFHDARLGLSNGQFWDGCEGPTRVVNELFRSGKLSSQWEIIEEKITAVVVRRKL